MKKFKKILKAILIIVIVLVVIFIGLFINGTNKNRKEDKNGNYSSWMSEIPDDAYLLNIAIPGSHDAGTKGIMWLAETQSYSIKDQLEFGCRYFDIRVNKIGDEYPIYHSIFNGDDFRDSLSDIKDFIISNPTEVILLDFQHFKNDSKDDVYNILKEELYDSNLVVINDSDLSDLEYIRNLKLKDVRGKVIVFFGETSEDFSNWIFLRNNDDCTIDNMCLDSYYIGSYHKGGFTSLVNDAHPIYFKKLLDKKKENINGIFVLQSQLTDGKIIFGPWAIERKMEDDMSKYIEDLSGDYLSNYGLGIDDINVVLRDFLTEEKCKEIIELNKYKSFNK